MKRKYIDWKPHRHVKELVATAENIIHAYSAQGYTLTLRQLYYQFVARDLIPNSEKSYKNLGTAISKARMAGMIDWTSIEDRNRGHHSAYVNESQLEAIDNTPYGIAADFWKDQDYYIEVWVEKEALGNVIAKACDPYRVTYMSCKGYLSSSEAWRAGQRFAEKIEEGKQCVLIHLGDHDPSGIDMTRDNNERVDMFSEFPGEVDVRRIALNMNQVRKYNPPENPAKITDSRFKSYVQQHGASSWELDALEPSVLVDMIQSEIRTCIDDEKWEAAQELQDELREPLFELVENWDDVSEFIRGGCEMYPKALTLPDSIFVKKSIIENMGQEKTAINALGILKRSRGILEKLGYDKHSEELELVIAQVQNQIDSAFE